MNLGETGVCASLRRCQNSTDRTDGENRVHSSQWGRRLIDGGQGSRWRYPTGCALEDLRREYEGALSRLLGVEHAVAFSFARNALVGTLRAVGLRAGDEVILSPLTCAVVPMALLALRLKPVYVDIDSSTLNVCSEDVRRKMRPSVKAILFQHTYGNPKGIGGVSRIAAAHGIWLIEDCAQCLPTKTADVVPRYTGHAAIFSNNFRKPLPAGCGGIAVTSDGQIAEQIRLYRDGLRPRSALDRWRHRIEYMIHTFALRPSTYWWLLELKMAVSNTYRSLPLEDKIKSEIRQRATVPDRFQMRCGLKWLNKVDRYATHRISTCKEYACALASIAGVIQPVRRAEVPMYYYPVLVPNKAELLRAAKKRRIELIGWPIKLPIFPTVTEREMQELEYEIGSCPEAEAVAARLVGIPTDPLNRPADRKRVVDLFRDYYGTS